MHEAPFVVDDTRPPTGPEYREELTAVLAEGRRGAAVRLFLALVGLPRPAVAAMRLTPLWPRLEAMAPTLVHDARITVEHQQGRPLAAQWGAVGQRTLVLRGGASAPWMRNGMQALADVLTDATLVTLEGQTHNLRPKVVAPEVARFLAPSRA